MFKRQKMLYWILMCLPYPFKLPPHTFCTFEKPRYTLAGTQKNYKPGRISIKYCIERAILMQD